MVLWYHFGMTPSEAVDAALLILGWMDPLELKWLAMTAAALTPGSTVVELGSWKGRSTKALSGGLPNGGRLYAVDHWKGSESERLTDQQEATKIGPDAMYEAFRRNLSVEIESGKVVPVRMSSDDGARHLSGLNVCADLIFLDGDHGYEATLRDIGLYRNILRPGGVLSGHDYGGTHVGVKRAVDQSVGVVQIGGRSIWWRRF
jgi:predicted O-methyltransferase YrrM